MAMCPQFHLNTNYNRIMLLAHLLLLPISPTISLYSYSVLNVLESRLHQYAQIQKHKTLMEYDTCSIFISPKSHEASITANKFIEIINCPSVITTRSEIQMTSDVKHLGQFVFLETLQEIPLFFERVSNPPRWQSNKPSHIFICSPPGKNPNVTAYLDYLWTKRIYPNVLIIMWQQLRILSHDPFLGKVEDLVECEECRFHNDHIEDLHGFPIRIGFYEYPPTLSKVNGDWVGTDYFTLRDVSEHLRATPTYIEGSREEIIEGFSNNTLDIIGSSWFIFNMGLPLDTSRCDFIFSRHEQIVALVPVAKQLPMVETVFLIAKSGTFTFVFALLIVFALAVRVLSFIHGLRRNYVECLLMCWQIILNSSIPLRLTRQPTLIQLVLLAWLTFSIVFNTIFLMTLWKIIFDPAFEGDIKTFSELKATGLEIYGIKNCVNAVRRQYGHWKQLREIDSKILDAMLTNKTTDVAYVLRRSAAEQYLSWEEKRPVYSIIEETVLQGILAYIIPKNSPFQTSLGMSFLSRNEHLSNTQTKARVQVETKIIDLGILQGMFILLFLGYGIAALIFLMELLIGNR